MKRGKILVAVSIVTFAGLSTSNSAQASCKEPASFGRDAKGNGKTTQFGNIWGSQVAFYSSNTDAGVGNGGELATLFGCITGLPVDDRSIQLGNAHEPFYILATDPGNSQDVNGTPT